MSPISDGRAVPQADRLTEPRARCPTDASVRGSSSQALARDEPESSRRGLTSRLLRPVDASVRRPTDLALGPRPLRAWRQRRTRARSFANGGVVCPMHTAVATSLTPSESVARTDTTDRPRLALVLAHGADTSRESARRATRSSIPMASRCGARPGKGILGRIRPSLPRRPYEDGHLLQLERCHDVQQHSGGLAAAGGGGHAPRRRVDWSCGSACRRWPGARSGAAC